MYLEMIDEEGPDNPHKEQACGSVIAFRHSGDDLEILVGCREKDPEKGEWSVPGGHVDDGETPEEGARREFEEETGLKVKGELILIDKSPREKKRTKIDYIYATVLETDEEPASDSDLRNVRWTAVSKLPELAFDGLEYVCKAVVDLFGEDELAEDLMAAGIRMIAESIDADGEEQEEEPGILIVFEGIDGSGKSTQVEMLVKWLEEQDYTVGHTAWASGCFLGNKIKKYKKKRKLTPLLYSLAHITDLVDRYENEVLPVLAANGVVVCDRYIYTSIVRDKLRGIDGIHDAIFKDMREPDLLFHCDLPANDAFERLLSGKGMSYYGAGMDLGYSKSKEENCIRYQREMNDLYAQILPKVANYQKLDTSGSPEEGFEEVKRVLEKKFKF